MIKAILRNGVITPRSPIPKDWLEGQELVITTAEPKDDCEDLKSWIDALEELSAQIPHEDHAIVKAAWP